MPRKIYFLITFFTGIIILIPQINFQYFLSQGDHGINLYGAQAILRGERPYQDFVWYYGPAMLYYYAFFLKILGGGIQSILFAKTLLVLASGLVIFFCLSSFIPAAFSCLGTLWYWIFLREFPYTYNHIGGVCLATLICCLTLRYIKKPKPIFLYSNLFLIFLLSLIKFNIGLSTLVSLVICTIASDLAQKENIASKRFLFYVFASIILPTIIFISYWLFLQNLPSFYSQQCFPYFIMAGSTTMKSQQTAILNIIVNGVTLFQRIISSWTNFTFFVLMLISTTKLLIKFKKNSFGILEKKHSLVIFTITVFYLFSQHEFVTNGVFYQSFWGDTFKTLLSFILIGLAFNHSSRIIKTCIGALILLIAIIQAPLDYSFIQEYHKSHTKFNISPTDITINNTPDWTSTVSLTTHFLRNHLTNNDLFWAIPYDPLYYFLTNKPSPTRQMMFPPLAHISSKDELSIIKEIETKKINWVLISNRFLSNDPALAGNRSLITQDYLNKNFTLAAEFGSWDKDAGWWWDHGVRILKRKSPLM